MTRARRLRALALVLAAAALGFGVPRAEGEKERVSAAKALLDAKKYDEALASAEEALESYPEYAELLDLASLAALESGDNDRALWYATLARDELPDTGKAAPKGKGDAPDFAFELENRIATLDPLEDRGRKLVAAYAQALLELARACAKRKLFVNAVDLLARCERLGRAEPEEELEKIYANKKAVEALLASGLDVPLKSKKQRGTAAKISREDAKHATWENHWEVKGDNYTVRTNRPLAVAERISLAMEQMNQFYRKVFKVKERGGDTARVTLDVYSSHEEFMEKEGTKPSIGGFFQPGANRVATFDGGRQQGQQELNVWSTLFHESSHQFTDLISADLIPVWLNEGTASYFEGARLLANGSVETNLVPEYRLQALESYIRSKTLTLKQVVSFYEEGSYPGEYYPYGWGLVYFLLNYEDENCARVYQPLYYEYLAAYKSGGKHDPFERFVEYFVTRAKQPGVASFEAFEQRWNEWIHELYGLYFGGSPKADALVERARKQKAKKMNEAALESYRWALRKRPDDAIAALEFAELLAELDQTDAALFQLRRALEAARARGDAKLPVRGSTDVTGEQLEARARERMAKLDPAFAKEFVAADQAFVAGTLEAAGQYAEKEFPLAALVLLDGARALGGENGALASLRATIAKDSGADTLRWRRPAIDGELALWEREDGWTGAAGVLTGTSDDPSSCTLLEEPPDRFRFEVTLELGELGEDDFAALVFGVQPEGLLYLGVSGAGGAGLIEFGAYKDAWKSMGQAGVVAGKDAASIPLAIEVEPGAVEFFVRGKPAGRKEYDAADLRGRIGVLVQGCTARFSTLRVKS